MSKKTWIISAVVGVLVLFILIPGCVAYRTYNNLVMTSEQVDTSWSQVENVMERRYDLIPNLVNTVKGYAKQEKEVLENVTRMRSQWGEARTPGDRIAASDRMESAISRLLLVAENYPQLKSNENFLRLQDELAGTENRIAVERRRYNESVRNYNIIVRRFPANIFAGMFGFARKDAYFKAKEEAQEAPKVEF